MDTDGTRPGGGGEDAVLEQTQRLDPFVLKLVLAFEIPSVFIVGALLVVSKTPWHVMPIVLGAMAVAPIIVTSTKLRVRVEADRLRHAFPPFWFGSTRYSAIESVEVVKVDAMRDFMGWGVKVVPKATGYVAKSGGGVRITRTGKKRALVITSDDAEALAAAILGRVVALGDVQLGAEARES